MERIVLYQILFLFSLSIAFGKDSVPVLIWDTQKAPNNLPAVSALQSVPFTTFQKKYLGSFQPENILLFLQDALSVEDLSSHADELQHLGSLVESSHSLYLPSVEDASLLAHYLPAHGYSVVTLEPGSAISELKLKKNSNNLVIVKLPPTVTNPSRKKALQKNDEVIENVVSKIGKMANFTIIFTGKEPAVKADSNVVHRRVSRSLNEEPRIPGLHQSKCVLLYLRGPVTLIKGNSSGIELPDNNTSSDKGDCQDEKASIIILYVDVNEMIKKVNVQFNFHKKSRRWTFQDAELYEQSENDTNKVTLLPNWPMEDIPFNKSYTCSQKLVLKSNMSADNVQYRLIVDGMQVEAFTQENPTRFHDGWDCVGFFTIPIWMGVLAGILLTIILAAGLYMLSQVKTMDRFDDPKAKHFMIAGSSE